MISPINIAIFLLWLQSALFDYVNFCYIWQLKEYRIDRFKDFIGTKQGKSFFQSYPFLWRSLLAIVIFIWPINDLIVVKYLIIAIFLLDGTHNAFQTILKKFKRPVITFKASLIIILSMFIEGIIFVLTRDWILLVLLLIFRFLIISLIIFILSFPTKWLKKYYIKKAKNKLSKYKNLIVIGITGSYGKSSVKEFLAHILSDKFNVVHTPRNINTEIGVAKYILNKDFNGAEIFIVEMGAYRIGEIQLICEMVKPKIGILTAITEQHLSLFGSIENIQKAKYELLESLPKDGYAITNADNFYCMQFLNKLKVEKKETFGSDSEKNPTCLITNVEPVENGIKCCGSCLGEEACITAPVIGTHHAFNIAAAIMVAIHLGLDKEKIFEAISTLPKTTHGSLKIYKYGKATIIDDSYNSNPEGFKAALDVLAGFPSEKNRIVVTRGMLELGEKSATRHEEIGGEIAFVADELVVISKDSFEPLKKGVGEKYKTKVILKDKPKDLLKFIKLIKNENAAVLLENRIPGIVMDELKK